MPEADQNRPQKDSTPPPVPDTQRVPHVGPANNEPIGENPNVQVNAPPEHDSLTPATVNVEATQTDFDRVRPKNTRKTSRITCLVLVVVFAIGSVVALMAGGSFLSWQSEASEQVAERYGQHPVVVEELGGLERCRFSVLETATHNAPRDDVLAFRIDGKEAIGFLYVHTKSGEPKDATWAGLRIDDQFWPLEND